MQKVLYPLLGIISTILLIINLLFITLFIIIFVPFLYLVPVPTWRRKCVAAAMNIPAVWYRSCYYLLKINRSVQWEVTGEQAFNKKGWYLLICNHISWLDIPVVAGAYSYKMPVIKFFMKKELLWGAPLVGLSCKLLGYPFLERGKKRSANKRTKGGADLSTTQKACEQIKVYPTTLFMFVEGTRVTEQKQQRQHSPYQHLLKPRAGGMATVLHNMHPQLDGIIDVTLNYKPREFTLLGLTLGKVKKVQLSAKIIPVEEALIGDYYRDTRYKKEMREWLAHIWQQKDATITEMIKDDKATD